MRSRRATITIANTRYVVWKDELGAALEEDEVEVAAVPMNPRTLLL
jgi:hypothetical protein